MIETVEQFYQYNAVEVEKKNISYDEAILVVDEFCSEYND